MSELDAPDGDGAESLSGAASHARRIVAGPTKRAWRLARRVMPDAIAEPLRVGVRSGLRTAGLIGQPATPADECIETGASPGSPDGDVPTEAVDQDPVVFFHVMKCGGTSVRVGLSMGITGERNGSDVFELDGEAAKLSTGGRDQDNWKFRDALLPYVLRAMRPAVVLGHFRYRDAYRDLMDDARFVTVLRDPMDRLVSLYKYRLYHEGIDVAVSGGFDQFIASKRWANEGHAYVTTFCGDAELDPRSDAAIAAAVTNLERFAVVGFTEQLDAFSEQVTECVGRPVTISVVNASPAPETALDREVADATERLRDLCAPDLQVYEQVLALRSRTIPASATSARAEPRPG